MKTNLELAQSLLRGKVVTLDCNTLLLFAVGRLDRKNINHFKRTNTFYEDDFNLLTELIKHSKLVLSSNVLTEASNLLESYRDVKGRNGLAILKELIHLFPEQFEYSKGLSAKISYDKFGLSDSSMDHLCESGVTVITVDFPLFGYLSSRKLPVINFNNIRSEYFL